MSSKASAWSGVFPAVTTQFSKDGALQLDATQKEVDALIKSGVHGLIMLGTCGENCSLLPEEKRQGTSELILTSPITSGQIVLGKYLGALAISLVMLGGSLAFIGVLTEVSSPDLRSVASLYLGVFLLGATFLAIGLCLSAFTDNQVLAYVLGVGVLLVLWFLSGISKSNSINETLGDRATGFLSNLSVIEHFPDFTKGIVDTQHVVYYLSVIAFSLLVAQRALDSHRWR